MSYALLAPGQGSQTPSMRETVAAHAPDLLERLGDEPFARAGESTRFQQPAIFAASVAGWRRIREERGDPVAAAGHSLGELAALVAADAIDADAALDLVVLRGRLMALAREGSMLALLGAGDEEAERLAAAHGVSVANFNAPGQVVLAGDGPRLDALAAAAREQGLRALELGVTGAFHSPAMEPSVAPFRTALRGAAWRAPRFPVLSGASAAPFEDPAEELATALVRPVRWVATMHALAALGADQFVDVGPGGVLAKLVVRIFREAPAHA